MATETAAGAFTAAQLDALVDDLNRDGLCVLRGVFDRGLVEEWAAAFKALFSQKQHQPGGLAPREQSRFYLTLPWVPPFANADVFANPAILGVLDRVFAQECAAYPEAIRLFAEGKLRIEGRRVRIVP